MTKRVLFVLAVAAGLCGCGGGSQYSTDQRSIDADIAAAHDQGPTAVTQNSAQITFAPQLTVPLKDNY